MNRALTLVLVAGIIATSSVDAARRPIVVPTTPIYINNAPVTTPPAPQIDAEAFLNRSIFDVATSLPYQAQNVRYWTNNGSMNGVPGWEFRNNTDGAHYRRPNGRRIVRNSKRIVIPSATFVNNGNISAGNVVNFGGVLFNSLLQSELNISATNVISPGRLDGTESSFIRIDAPGYADLSRGGLRAGPSTDPSFNCGFFSVSSNFTADPGVRTIYWGGGRNNDLGTNGQPLNLAALNSGIIGSNVFFGARFNVPFPSSPSHQVLRRSGRSLFTNVVAVPGFTGLFSGGCGDGYEAFVHSNRFGTSTVISVVFVPTSSLLSPTNMGVQVFFSPNSGPAGQAYAPVVEFQNTEYDIVNRAIVTNYVTLVDSTASQTNVVFARPLASSTGTALNTRRPWSYTWIRGRLCNVDSQFGLVDRANMPFSPTMFYDPATFGTNIVNTLYAAEQVQVGQSNSTVFVQPTIIIGNTVQLGVNPGLSDPTNFSGSVNINARELNLSSTRIRAEEFIRIKTDNLVSNSFAQIDAPFIDFDVRSTNINLVISNISPPSVSRLAGTISAWSSAWNVDVITTNLVSTNIQNHRYHVLIVDNCLRSEQPVTMHRFFAAAPSITIEDNLFVNSAVKLDVRDLTIGTNGGLNLPAPNNLAYTNVLDLVNFTNFGAVNVPGAAYFGIFEAGHIPARPRPRRRRPVVENPAPLDNFVNHGSITASSIMIRGTNVESSGRIISPATLRATGGVITMIGDSVLVSNATLLADSDIEIRGNDIATVNTFFSAGSFSNFLGQFVRGSVVIDATNSFGDFGDPTANDWIVTGGLRIPTQPSFMGDLMGTRVYSIAAPLVSSIIVWPGEDRGVSPAGFANNLALGRLVLDGRGGNLFRFQSAGGSNALYVDYLELLNDATNYNFAVGVDPNFTIYFGDANVPPEKLNNVSGGRLRWVSTFTGPQSSTNLVYPNGNTYTFNAGLVRSLDIDSDGDGIVNGLDCTPIPVSDLDTVAVNCPTTPPPSGPVGASAAMVTYQGFAAMVTSPEGASPQQSVVSAPELGVALSRESGEVVLTWSAVAGSANTVEFTDQIGGGTWQTLTNFISGPVDARISIKDAVDAPLRIYRVRVDLGTK